MFVCRPLKPWTPEMLMLERKRGIDIMEGACCRSRKRECDVNMYVARGSVCVCNARTRCMG